MTAGVRSQSAVNYGDNQEMRRKGERTDRHRNQSHPFQVEIQIPTGGLGYAMEIMYRWAAWHSHETTGAMRSMRWCFCQREVADAFATDFGGLRIDMPVNVARLAVDQPDARELERRAQAAAFGLMRVESGRR